MVGVGHLRSLTRDSTGSGASWWHLSAPTRARDGSRSFVRMWGRCSSAIRASPNRRTSTHLGWAAGGEVCAPCSAPFSPTRVAATGNSRPVTCSSAFCAQSTAPSPARSPTPRSTVTISSRRPRPPSQAHARSDPLRLRSRLVAGPPRLMGPKRRRGDCAPIAPPALRNRRPPKPVNTNAAPQGQPLPCRASLLGS
jgi:hypothetical protein